MSTKPLPETEEAPSDFQFLPAPPEELTAYFKINWPGYPGSLAAHFGNPETTVITSEIAAALIPSLTYEGVRYPDLLIAFNADPVGNIARHGYLIPEQGKPPDFVLEVASRSTGRRDETVKRNGYAGMGVVEYWRFDPTGGRFHRTHLAGDRLVDGEYQPVLIHRVDDEHLWGHSEALNLDLCWERGELRWYDPVGRRYLPTFDDERTARITAESQRDVAAAQLDAAETRVRELEEQLRRAQEPGSP